MNFRNMTFYRFPAAACAAALAALEAAAAQLAFREPGPLELSTRGFVSPLTWNTSGEYVLSIGSVSIIAMASARKIIPSSVIAEELKKKTDAIAAAEGRTVGGRERKRLKKEVVTELMQRALSCRTVTLGFIDATLGWVVVGTASRGAAGEFIAQIREALGRFPATPLAPDESPRATMTDWIIKDATPLPWRVGDECVLRDPSECGSRWAGRGIELDSNEVKEHLRAGMQVVRLGLELAERCTFVLDDSLCVRKFALTDIVRDALFEDGFESAAAECEATLRIESGVILELLARIDSTFGTPMPVESN